MADPNLSQEIDRMEAGRELDAMVAEKVMGLRPRWWSLHRNDKPLRDLMDTDVRPTLFWLDCQSLDHVPLEVLRPNADGDMPILECDDGESVLCYSTDIAAAWEVVEKLKEITENVLVSWEETYWEVEVCVTQEAFNRGYRTAINDADTAPLAICRAALIAVAK